MLIGLTGRAGAGKDTAFERIDKLVAWQDAPVERFSFAAPLKASVCALFGLDLDELEQWKRSEGAFLLIAPHRDDEEADVKVDSWMTMRTLLQRYGTEAHRGVFGEDFWVDKGIDAWAAWAAQYDGKVASIGVFTDVRFENEARVIREAGGKVFEVVGPLGAATSDAEHVSETGLSDALLDGYIINSKRDDDYAMLDKQIVAALGL